VTDTPLDNILSGGSTAAPAGNEVEKDVAQVDQVQADGQTDDQQADANQDEPESGGQRMVPQAALHAEKQKVKRYTEEVADFRKQLADTNTAWERRMAQLVEAVKPKQEVQQAAPPDIFEKPDDFVRHTVGPQFDQLNQTLLANARLVAEFKFGDDKVNEAENAFITAVQSQTLDPSDYQKVVNSPNRYAEAVKWHQRQQAQAEIGEDPAAYKARVEAEIKAKYGITDDGQPPAQQAKPAMMPSNLAGARNVGSRSGPAWAGPQSIADIFKR
jgi:hypothetical protein